MDLKILHNKVFVFEKAIPNAQEMYDHFDNIENKGISGWQEWTDPGNGKSYGKSKSFHDTHWTKEECDPKTLAYLKQYTDIFDECVRIYTEKNNINLKIKENKSFAILRYDKSKQTGLGEHIDTRDDYVGEEHSILIYWTESYTGGELYFKHYPINFKPNAGDIVIFSATDRNLLHGTYAVESGVKAFSLQYWESNGKAYNPPK